MVGVQSGSVKGEVSLMEGGDALPRKSGDLVFHDLWEKRAFAIALVLYESGYYDSRKDGQY